MLTTTYDGRRYRVNTTLSAGDSFRSLLRPSRVYVATGVDEKAAPAPLAHGCTADGHHTLTVPVSQTISEHPLAELPEDVVAALQLAAESRDSFLAISARNALQRHGYV